jgi:hypothetical protein
MPTIMPYNLPGDEVDNIGIGSRMLVQKNPRLIEEEKNLSANVQSQQSSSEHQAKSSNDFGHSIEHSGFKINN